MSAKPVDSVTLHQRLKGRGLTSTQRDVLQAMASYGDYHLREIRPSLETVAREFELNVKTVRDAVNVLRERGFLIVVKEGGGRGNPTHYAIVDPSETLPSNGTLSRGNTPVSVSETLPSDSVNPPVSLHKPSRQTGTNQSLTNSLPVKNHQGEADASDEFSCWFQAYPRQEQRAKAKDAYRRARQKTDAKTLLDGAKKYSEQVARSQTEPRYVKLPANWLAKESWRDFETETVFTSWNEERTVTRAEKNRMDEEAARRERDQAWYPSAPIDPYAGTPYARTNGKQAAS